MKKFRISLAAIMLIIFIAGCDNGGASTPVEPIPTEKDAIEITVITSYGGDDGNRQNFERALSTYEATSGNIVKDLSGISNEEWKSHIMTSFETGTEPDVLFYFTGVDSNKIIQNEKVVSIDEIRALYPDYASNMKEDMLPTSPVDDKSYAVPVNGYWEGLYVNKKVLADCGVTIPDENTTWDQFLKDCQKIADKGYVPIAASLQEVPHYWFEYCVFNNGTIEGHPILPESPRDEIGKSWTAGLNDIQNLYERGFFPANTLTATNAEICTLMINDKAAFMIDGSWQVGWFAENAADVNNFSVTYVPGKGTRTSTDMIGGISMGYFITKKAWDNPQKQAACVEFVTAMTTDDVVITFGVTAVTALKNNITPPDSANRLVTDALQMTRNATGYAPATADGLSPDSRKNLFANVSKIVTGKMSAEKAIAECLATQ